MDGRRVRGPIRRALGGGRAHGGARWGQGAVEGEESAKKYAKKRQKRALAQSLFSLQPGLVQLASLDLGGSRGGEGGGGAVVSFSYLINKSARKARYTLGIAHFMTPFVCLFGSTALVYPECRIIIDCNWYFSLPLQSWLKEIRSNSVRIGRPTSRVGKMTGERKGNSVSIRGTQAATTVMTEAGGQLGTQSKCRCNIKTSGRAQRQSQLTIGSSLPGCEKYKIYKPANKFTI